MGKSKANYAITGLSGKVGKIFVYRQRAGGTIVATLTHIKTNSIVLPSMQKRPFRRILLT
ncbi:hypothetical protein CBG49_01200 [Capnocytophaga endodontalis]|uniref:Uncharacterized protein n=1 Tax=Capnocytophaga endodontalis TaxID=2708117 RepID=A0A1Z4BKM1_9FLAO|nr:hypothetical protein CBG49_01200 [Capnocytophaga endodontalis]